MIGFGTLLNVAGILAGGLLGLLIGKFLKPQVQDGLTKSCGVCVIFLGVASAMSGMLSLQDGGLSSGHTMLLIACLAPGALVGELLGIENRFERLGQWLKIKTGNARDSRFTDAFVTTSLTVCIGAMAIVGAIQDGLLGDSSTLATKAILDMIVVLVMTASLGKGCIFSALPVGVLQGSVTLLARLLRPLLTDAALANLSLIGSVLIFCVGINLTFGKKIRAANLLPAIVFAVALAFVPVSL